MNNQAKEVKQNLIRAIEKVEVDFLSRGRMLDAVAALTEIDKEYPGQYLAKISLAEAHLMKGDRAAARRFLFLAANLRPSDSRFELLTLLLNSLDKSSPDAHQTAVQKIERKGVNAFHYFMGIAHYYDVYHNQEDRKELLILLASTHQNDENRQIILEACAEAEISNELLNGLKSKTPKTFSS